MAESELTLPSDVEIRLCIIQQEHINQQNDLIKQLLIRHETELAMLWGLGVICVGALMFQSYKTYKGVHNGSR